MPEAGMSTSITRHLLKRVIQADDRCHAALKTGVAEGEQHAARNKQVPRHVVLCAAGADRQCQISRSRSKLLEIDRRAGGSRDSWHAAARRAGNSAEGGSRRRPRWRCILKVLDDEIEPSGST